MLFLLTEKSLIELGCGVASNVLLVNMPMVLAVEFHVCAFFRYFPSFNVRVNHPGIQRNERTLRDYVACRK